MLPYDRLFRGIVEGTPDAVLYSDREGIIRYWNAGAERIFLYSREEALGRNLNIIIPERLRTRHWSGYRQVMEGGESKYVQDLLAVPALRKDGSQISVEFSIIPLKDSSGQMLGIAAIIRDVTARWQQGRALQQRVAQLEERLRQTSS